MSGAPAGISEADWQATPTAVRAFILVQQAELQAQRQEIQALRQANDELRAQLTALAAQGASLRQMADALAAAGTTTKAGKPLSPSSVKLQLERLGLR